MIIRRTIAWFLLLVFSLDLMRPNLVHALTSGPSQPEVQGFQPVSSSDLVDPFTGDFSYNIPLLDIEGYPINLFYSGGVTMEQEASWVGLGWNINPGVVNRNLRGIPDDHKGDQITREINLRPNKTFGISAGVSMEILGTPPIGPSLPGPPIGSISASVSPTYNNYHGVRTEVSIGMGLNASKSGKSAFTAGLGLSSGSHSGLRLQPNIGFDAWKSGDSKVGLNLGTTIDSREGMKSISFGAEYSDKGGEYTKADDTKGYHEKKSSTGVGTSFNIGTPTYTPQLNISMENIALSFNFTIGAEAQSAHPGFRGGASFSQQKVRDNIVRSPSFGYLYLDAAYDHSNAVMDFNRENGGPYTPDQAALGMSHLTNDIFSVSAQGLSGSYRPYRSEVGHVYDPRVTSTANDGSLGLELGVGGILHGGADVMVNSVQSWSGRWSQANEIVNRLKYLRSGNTGRPAENVFFRSASEPVVELDSSLYTNMGGDRPYRFFMSQIGGYDMKLHALLDPDDNTPDVFPYDLSSHLNIKNKENFRRIREPRAQLFNYLTHGSVESGSGLHDLIDRPGSTLTNIPRHHMSEITILDQESKRFVFGIPAYNLVQKEVTFNVDQGSIENNGQPFIGYSDEDASTGNKKGIDHFYSCSTTPAYAHSFLLTAIVSKDYSDIDGIRGPSDGDLGTFTKFDYSLEHHNYPWRTPASPAGMARLERGLGATTNDDKASYVYGEKEIWYLNTIESRNRIAVFELNDPVNDPRRDGLGINEDGSINTGKRLRYLTKISLYDKKSYLEHQQGLGPMPVPVKEVHFEYNHTLCPGTPNSESSVGKLTLTKVYFTYGRSNMGVTSPYVFNYDPEDGTVAPLWNPSYDFRNMDRWGNFKFDRDNGCNTISAQFPSASCNRLYNNEFPYAEQVEELADLYAGAWSLRHIHLPSGGKIEVQYESDDYAFVQNKRATRMFRLHMVDEGAGVQGGNIPAFVPASGPFRNMNYLYFELPDDIAITSETVNQLVADLDLIYFRTKIEYIWSSGFPSGADHVSGYAKLVPGSAAIITSGSTNYGVVRIQDITLDEDGGPIVSPIYRAAFEHARLNYPEQLFAPEGFSNEPDAGSVTLDFIRSMAGALSGLLTGLTSFFTGPNKDLEMQNDLNGWSNPLHMRWGESWIKLVEPDARKKGGGQRVKEVIMHDHWDMMENSGFSSGAVYVQAYEYGDENGSWGIAAYEPMIGADENPMKRPVYQTVDRLLSSDERFYMEEPFGESMFPSPVVGYSKVIVRNKLAEGLGDLHGTGFIAHEFHTARDFPTITRRTGIKPRQKKSPGMSGLVGVRAFDHMHVTQGFVVETNDMHGKPRSMEVYAEDGETIISAITYHYKIDQNTGRLRNDAKVIYPDGTIQKATIGRNYEFVADLREFGSIAQSGGAHVNLDVIFIFVPIPIPPIIPKMSSESTRFRSGVLVKKIENHGLLEKVVKIEHGSAIYTENLAYDALTGRVLLTRSNNEFGDPVYSMDFPAYWKYDGMGPAYRNLNMMRQLTFDAQGRATVIDAQDHFVPGDELAITVSNGPPVLVTRGWVHEVEPGAIHVIDVNGAPIADISDRWATVVRSGRRNMQDVIMANVISRSDPLAGLPGNVYQRVLNASATEYKDQWRTDCACHPVIEEGGGNPFIDNRRGVWRLHRERAWLSERVRSLMNENVDLRNDGVYSSFSPFFKIQDQRWRTDEAGWTMVREVQDYSPRSQEIEEMDALGLFATATYSHRGMMTNSVTRNAMVQESGFASFESGYPADCADKHFLFQEGSFEVTSDKAHTGRRSIKVEEGQEARLHSIRRTCDLLECGFEMVIDPNGPTTQVIPIGENGPYVFNSIEPVEGDPIYHLGSNGSLYIQNGSSWRCSISITSSTGCTRVIEVQNPMQ